jgi:hypothetical protein
VVVDGTKATRLIGREAGIVHPVSIAVAQARRAVSPERSIDIAAAGFVHLHARTAELPEAAGTEIRAARRSGAVKQTAKVGATSRIGENAHFGDAIPVAVVTAGPLNAGTG